MCPVCRKLQAIRSAIKTSVASRWHFISTHSLEQFVVKHTQSVLFTDGASPVNYKGKGKKGKGFPVHDKKTHTRNPEV